jgi:hypothetical protein
MRRYCAWNPSSSRRQPTFRSRSERSHSPAVAVTSDCCANASLQRDSQLEPIEGPVTGQQGKSECVSSKRLVAWRSSHDRPVGYGAIGVDRASCATSRHSSTVWYVNDRTRTIVIVFCGEAFWLILIGVVHVHSAPDKEFLALVASLMLVIAIRSGFSYVLILEPEGSRNSLTQLDQP